MFIKHRITNCNNLTFTNYSTLISGLHNTPRLRSRQLAHESLLRGFKLRRQTVPDQLLGARSCYKATAVRDFNCNQCLVDPSSVSSEQ